MCLEMNEKVKTLWDMKIQTDKIMAQSRPDIVVLEKEGRYCNRCIYQCDEIHEFHVLDVLWIEVNVFVPHSFF